MIANQAQNVREKMLYARVDLKGDAELMKEDIVKVAQHSSLVDRDFTVVIDLLPEGKISIDDWMGAFNHLRENSNTQDFMRAIQWTEGLAAVMEMDRQESLFKMLDADGNGTLDIPELIAFCADLCKFSTNSSNARYIEPGGAQHLLNECDEDDNGQVTLREWMMMWKNHRWDEGSHNMSTMLFGSLRTSGSKAEEEKK